MVTCPAHAAREPSLCVRQGAERVLLHCFAGCQTIDVLEADGLLAEPDPIPA